MATATKKRITKKPVVKHVAKNVHVGLSTLTDGQVLDFINEQRKRLPDVTQTGIFKAIRAAGHSISEVRVRSIFHLDPVRPIRKATPRKTARKIGR